MVIFLLSLVCVRHDRPLQFVTCAHWRSGFRGGRGPGARRGERLDRQLPVLSRWPILRGRERIDIWWLGIRSFRRDQTAKTGKKAARQDRIMHFPLSAALPDTLVCRAEPKGNIWGKQFTMSIGKHGPKHMHVHSCSGPPSALRVP